jgi:hypothetical protein
MTLVMMTFSITTLSTTTLSMMTLNISTLGIKTLSIMGLFATLSINDISITVSSDIMLSVAFHLLSCRMLL